MVDGEEYDGKQLLELANAGKNPFEGQWSVQTLLEEIESHVGVQIADISLVAKGSNNFVRVSLLQSDHIWSSSRSLHRAGHFPAVRRRTRARRPTSQKRCQHARL